MRTLRRQSAHRFESDSRRAAGDEDQLAADVEFGQYFIRGRAMPELRHAISIFSRDPGPGRAAKVKPKQDCAASQQSCYDAAFHGEADDMPILTISHGT